MDTDRNSLKEGAARPLGRRPDLDEVNDASFDSFPASDPPVWSSMIAGPPKLERALEPQTKTESKRPER